MKSAFYRLRKLLIAFSLSLATFGVIADNQRPFVGAGILPYAMHDGRIVVLLGHDAGRGWTGFGGRPTEVSSLSQSAGRGETPVETALREGFEECRMVIPLPELAAGLDPARYFPRSGDGKAFRTYTVKISWRPEQDFRDRAVPVHSAYSEKSGYYWIPLEDLRQQALAGNRTLKNSPNGAAMRPIFWADLQPALTAENYLDLFPNGISTGT